MKHHPFTEIWPLLGGKLFEQLKADIKANGLKMPVLVYKDQVLDGRNRERACEETGVKVQYADAGVKTDHDALNLVVSLNQYRRHLTIAELAFAAEKLATLQRGGARNFKGSRGPLKSETGTLNNAADAVGCSKGSVKRARVIRNHGTATDVEDVISGRTSLKARAAQLQTKANAHKRTKKPSQDNGDRTLTFINAPPIKSMTQAEVDPEFTGTPMQFTDKYGHVQVMNAEQYATEGFSAWSTNMRALAKKWKELPAISRPVDHNWLRSAKPYDIAKLTEALDYLRPKIAEAEALLARAVATAKAKTQ